MMDDMPGPLTDAEQRQFFELLRRACLYHVDQFVEMKVEEPHMTFYIDIGLAPIPGHEDLYFTVDADTRLTIQGKRPESS